MMDKHFQALRESKAAIDDSVRADANKWQKLLWTLKNMSDHDSVVISVDKECELILNATGDCYGTVEIEIFEKD